MTKHVVGFSGGIDSQACSLWVRRHFPPQDIILLNTQAGRHEHPLTAAFVDWYSAHVFPVTIVTPLVRDLKDVGNEHPEIRRRRQSLGEESELTFDLLAWVKLMFPRSQISFCTEYLKLAPQVRWCRENLADQGEDYERYIGVRADESRKRALLAEKEWDRAFDTWLHRPVLRWTKQECFDFVAAASEEVNPLYRMGQSRVGCWPCVKLPKEQVREWAARATSEEIERIRAMERLVGKPFFAGKVPHKEGWVDEAIEWSKTTRGGTQLSLPFVEAEAQAGSCSSKYGLCE
jgi:3'-phosphoadenosine 5'-phosphosulfate sulfotransferase (PAPS reductase)/FAD synthetase